jgi:hypothetical protein
MRQTLIVVVLARVVASAANAQQAMIAQAMFVL